jgi:hypothetical protein
MTFTAHMTVDGRGGQGMSTLVVVNAIVVQKWEQRQIIIRWGACTCMGGVELA